MQAIVETLFDAFYLVFVISIGIRIEQPSIQVIRSYGYRSWCW